jgi:HPt (histidine-containing phosphotransfer) domain-containing protein
VVPGTSGSGERLAEKLANSEHVATDETIDLRAAASRIPGGLRGVRGLAEVFLPECDSLMQTLRAEIPAGDATLIQQAAHTLKGSANLFLATRVHDAAYKIERTAKNRDLAHSADDLKVLEQEVQSMLRALNNFLDITAND